MISYESRIVIARPPQEVFAALTDPARLPEWTDMVDVRFDPGPPRVGASGTFRLAKGPIKGDLAARYTAVEPDRRVEYQIEHPWLSWHAVSELTPVAGGTELRYAGDVRLRGVRRLLERLLASEVRHGERSEAERLKALLEGGRSVIDTAA
jgi:uncharacterized protein YndB with AHSA1/START domain